VESCIDCCLVGFKSAFENIEVASFFLLGCTWEDYYFFRETRGQLGQGRRAPLYEECPKHHGYKGDLVVTPGTLRHCW
jgi:hypothetical protein